MLQFLSIQTEAAIVQVSRCCGHKRSNTRCSRTDNIDRIARTIHIKTGVPSYSQPHCRVPSGCRLPNQAWCSHRLQIHALCLGNISRFEIPMYMEQRRASEDMEIAGRTLQLIQGELHGHFGGCEEVLVEPETRTLPIHPYVSHEH